MEGSASTHRGHGASPFHEYLLQGSVVDNSCDVLLNRLRGLCDNAENDYESFHDHELIFSLRPPTNANIQPVYFRVRHSLKAPNAPWHLRYVGLAEVGDKTRHTLVRTYVDVSASDNVVTFLNEMGFSLIFPGIMNWNKNIQDIAKAAAKKVGSLYHATKLLIPESILYLYKAYICPLEYEYVIKGYFFHKGRMKVTVSKIFRMLQPNNVENLEPLSLSYLVELTVVAPAGQEQIQDDMKNFAEQLKPLVQLEKIDHRRLTMM